MKDVSRCLIPVRAQEKPKMIPREATEDQREPGRSKGNLENAKTAPRAATENPREPKTEPKEPDDDPKTSDRETEKPRKGPQRTIRAHAHI